MSLDQILPHGGLNRMLDGQLGFAPNVCPDDDAAAFPGYWIWRTWLYRNGERWGTIDRYWFDRDKLGWWVDYYPLKRARESGPNSPRIRHEYAE